MTLYERMNTIALVNAYAINEQTNFVYAGDIETIYLGEYRGMNFRVGETGTNEANILSIIRTYLRRKGNPGTVYCKLYLADVNHKPTGGVLASASHPQEDFVIDVLTLTDFIMSPSYILQSNTEYCFVLSGGTIYPNYYQLYVSTGGTE